MHCYWSRLALCYLASDGFLTFWCDYYKCHSSCACSRTFNGSTFKSVTSKVRFLSPAAHAFKCLGNILLIQKGTQLAKKTFVQEWNFKLLYFELAFLLIANSCAVFLEDNKILEISLNPGLIGSLELLVSLRQLLLSLLSKNQRSQRRPQYGKKARNATRQDLLYTTL